MAIDTGLVKLTRELLGETPVQVGESFNVHYATPSSFIKVTRPWVKPDRQRNELIAARAMGNAGVPVALPLFDDLMTYVDEDGKTRSVTYWERLSPAEPLSESEGLSVSAEWISRIFNLDAPVELAYCFQLSDFLHSVHVRLDGHTHPYAARIVDEVNRLSEQDPYLHPACAGLIHGDLHPDNLLNTTQGLRIIDWESSCCGPIEWDAAQNLRYTPTDDVPARVRWWADKGVDMERLFFYRRVRSMSSLSHMVAAGLTPPMYYRTLDFLGWDTI